MKNNTNMIIVLLVAAACILGVMTIGSYNADRAYATSADRTASSDYIMINGAISDSIDLLYVIDVPNRKLLAYAINPVRNTVIVVDNRVKLSTAFGMSSTRR
jgi:hypothetical protein